MKNLLFILTLTFLMAACEKPVYDYRSKYEGEYHVTQENESWVMGQGVNHSTSNFDVKVKRSNNRYYILLISDQGESEYLIEKDGTLHFESVDWHYHVEGKFESKEKYVLSGGYYGLGGGYSFSATGIKFK